MTTAPPDLQAEAVGEPAIRAPAAPAGSAADGDQPRFDAIFLAHADAVRRTLVHLGVWERDADDETQHVFETVWQKLPSYDQARGSMRAWILGIACNVARDWRKWVSTQRVRTVRLVGDARASDRRSSETASAEDAIHRGDLVRLLDRLLRELPEEQRVVFVMCGIEGLIAREVSTTLGVPINTVSSRLRLARARLEEALARLDAAEEEEA